nr:MAG TPA: hypothetical protein [Caudoviricetes sp.]
MNTILKFYFKQFTDDMSDEDRRLVRLYNRHIKDSIDSLRQYFIRNEILLADDIEYFGDNNIDDTDIVHYIKSFIFVLNDKYSYYNIIENLNFTAEYKIEEEYEFEAKFDIILSNNTITKFIEFGTGMNKHYGAKYKYYSYYGIKDTPSNKFYNMKEL